MAGRKYEQDRSKVHKTSVVVAVSHQEKDSHEPAGRGMAVLLLMR